MVKNKPLKIGITGGIGSGKSIVCKIFSMFGAPIYDADTRARWLANHDVEVKQKIIQNFGDESYIKEGLNRRYLAQTVFQNAALTELLNSIVHPAVGYDFESWLIQHQHTAYILKEAALLYESGSYRSLDKIIVVSAPLEMRIKRVLARDPQRSEEEIKAIIQKQLSEEEKIKKSDYVLYNDNSKLLIPQIEELDKLFRQLSNQG